MKCGTFLFPLFVLMGCGVSHTDYDKLSLDYEEVLVRCDSVERNNEELIRQTKADQALIKTLRDSIFILSYPADQRYEKIHSLVNEQQFEAARKEISDLIRIFPESKEAKLSLDLLKKVDELEAKKKQEEEKRKALGFKGIKTVASCTIDYNKVEISSISSGNTFTFDSYDDYYHYRTADRGNKYITGVMKITSENKDPLLPQPAVYAIVGDKMTLIGSFIVKFARWEDYGSYLGNYHDNGNDFAKSSSIRFKIGKEISEDILKKPYAIVLKKENNLVRNYDRFSNPPVSYGGIVYYPKQLVLDDFNANGGFVIIKTANL
jgi:hypothetical protein